MSDKKDYYKILGVDKNASDDELKKAYHKLSLKLHPDRQVGKSDDEKKKAEAKFKDINEAYSILSDKDKRHNYDQYGDPNGMPGFGGFGDFNPFGGFGGGSPFDDFFGRRSQRREEQIAPGSDIKMQVPLTIEEIFNGCTKKLKFDRDVRCRNCHGDGGMGRQTCPHCNGTGMVTETQRTPFGIIQNSHPCQHCQGKGYTYEHKCPTCNGTGFEKESTVVEINFPPGMFADYAIEKPGYGNESKSPKGETGKFYAIATYAFDKNKYKVYNLDVTEKITIPYYDMLLGCDVVINIPNGTKKKIHIPSCTEEGKLLRLYREGIKGNGDTVGDYYIEVHHSMPTEISEKSVHN